MLYAYISIAILERNNSDVYHYLHDGLVSDDSIERDFRAGFAKSRISDQYSANLSICRSGFVPSGSSKMATFDRSTERKSLGNRHTTICYMRSCAGIQMIIFGIIATAICSVLLAIDIAMKEMMLAEKSDE